MQHAEHLPSEQLPANDAGIFTFLCKVVYGKEVTLS